MGGITRMAWILVIIFYVDGNYILIKTLMTWDEARIMCHKNGGRLATFQGESNIGDETLLDCLGQTEEFWYGNYTEVSNWISLEGCYERRKNNSTVVKMSISRTESIQGCQKLCKSTVPSKFGVKGNICICNVNIKDMMTRVNDTDCDRRCDGTAPCGGDNTYNVYDNVEILSNDDNNLHCSTFTCNRKVLTWNSNSYTAVSCNASFPLVCNNGKEIETSLNWSDGMSVCLQEQQRYILTIKDKSVCSTKDITRNVRYWNAVFRSERHRYDEVPFSSYKDEDIVTPTKVKTFRKVDATFMNYVYEYSAMKLFPGLCETDGSEFEIYADENMKFCRVRRSTTNVSDVTTVSILPSPFTSNQTTDTLVTMNTSLLIAQHQWDEGSQLSIAGVIAALFGGILFTFTIIITFVCLRKQRFIKGRCMKKAGDSIRLEHQQTQESPDIENFRRPNNQHVIESDYAEGISGDDYYYFVLEKPEVRKETESQGPVPSHKADNKPITRQNGACHLYASVIRDRTKVEKTDENSVIGEDYDILNHMRRNSDIMSDLGNIYDHAKSPDSEDNGYDKLNRNRKLANISSIYDCFENQTDIYDK